MEVWAARFSRVSGVPEEVSRFHLLTRFHLNAILKQVRINRPGTIFMADRDDIRLGLFSLRFQFLTSLYDKFFSQNDL